MSEENEQALGDAPETIAPVPPTVAVRKVRDWEIVEPKKPTVYPPFFLWTPLFFFVIALMLYFFFPNALNDAIAFGYKEYNIYFPQVVAPAPKHVVAAIPAPKPPPPEPIQTYSVQEIKDNVQAHLVDAGVADKDSSFDWKRLQYTDPSDLIYELYTHSSQGQVELCMGKVTLDEHLHRMLITSQLVGW